MEGTFWAIMPALIAIILALLTKEVYSSLFCGILVGAFLANGFNPVDSFNTIVTKGLSEPVADLAGISIFLVILGSMVALLNKSGGSQAFGVSVKKKIRSRIGAGMSTFFLGVLIFIDDYFNCLTVGSVMRSVTDRYRISRAKLSYLIDATAAPICMIAPISSWAAAVSGVADDLGSGISGIQLFIQAIPYNFYSLLTLIFILIITAMDFDYGKMKEAQEKALAGDLGGEDAPEAEETETKGKVIDLVLPVIMLIIICFVAMLYCGGYFGKTPWTGAENTGNVIAAFGNTDAFVALPMGSLATFILSVIYFLARRTIPFREMMDCIPKGFSAMVPSIMILTLATGLKNITGELGAAEFVQHLMMGASSGLFNMLPAVIFIVSVALAFATGTSWGTFGLMIPVVMAAFKVGDPLLIIGISACLAGAVCGDHCSPISDTTVMSSAGAQIKHIDHVTTQFPYALSVAAVSFVSFVIAGFVKNWAIGLAAGIILVWLFLSVMRKRVGGKTPHPENV